MHNGGRDLSDIVPKIYCLAEIFGGQVLVEELKGLDPSRQPVQIDDVAVSMASRVKANECGDQLQIVFHAVLKLFQQQILVAQPLWEFVALCLLALRDVD